MKAMDVKATKCYVQVIKFQILEGIFEIIVNFHVNEKIEENSF